MAASSLQQQVSRCNSKPSSPQSLKYLQSGPLQKSLTNSCPISYLTLSYLETTNATLNKSLQKWLQKNKKLNSKGRITKEDDHSSESKF